MDLPGLPWSTPGGPEFFELLLFAHGVHGLPEAAMKERLHLTLCGKFLKGLSLKCCTFAGDFVDDRWGEDEESAVDPSAFALRFLLKCTDRRSVDDHATKPGHRMCRRHRCQLAVVFVEGDLGRDVKVTDAVSVSHTKSFFPL